MSEMSSQRPAPVEVGIVIVAAGSGQRLGRGIPKARVLCGGRTLLDHAIESVLLSGVATAVVAVLPEDDDVLAVVVAEAAARSAAGSIARPAAGAVDEPVGRPAGGSNAVAATGGSGATPSAAAGMHAPVRISAVAGGPTRTASVRAGLDALPSTIDVVLVHDAARALTPPAVFRRVATAVAEGAPAVIPVLPVVDTVKVVDGDLVTATPDRAGLRAVQTPQGFDAGALRAAHAGTAAAHPGVTDDAMLMEALGHAVRVVEGDPLAFKVTTPLDLIIAEAVLAERPVLGTPGVRVCPHEVSPAGPGNESNPGPVGDPPESAGPVRERTDLAGPATSRPNPVGPSEGGPHPSGPAEDAPAASGIVPTISRSSRVPE
ncbi:IspD/TarI family cytidylyltransferase [Arthrobacter sp. TMS1-12-1]